MFIFQNTPTDFDKMQYWPSIAYLFAKFVFGATGQLQTVFYIRPKLKFTTLMKTRDGLKFVYDVKHNYVGGQLYVYDECVMKQRGIIFDSVLCKLCSVVSCAVQTCVGRTGIATLLLGE